MDLDFKRSSRTKNRSVVNFSDNFNGFNYVLMHVSHYAINVCLYLEDPSNLSVLPVVTACWLPPFVTYLCKKLSLPIKVSATL